jgi:hypothetical protein
MISPILWTRNAKKGVKPIIGGDFNARLGNQKHYSKLVAKCLGPHGIESDINDRGRILTNFLQQLNLCNPASFFIKNNYSTWISKNTKKESTNRFHTLDYVFLMPFLDFKYPLIRDSAAIVDKVLPSTDHDYFVKMICTLRHNHNKNANNNNKKKKPKLPQPSSTKNTDPPAPSTTKSPPATQRNFLSVNPAATASYNQQIANTINSYKASKQQHSSTSRDHHIYSTILILCVSCTASKQKGMVCPRCY